jgi:DNA polymerase-3 subunit epsilon
MEVTASAPWDQVAYWSLDLETGGLTSRKDPILAVGMVPIRSGTIRLDESYSTLVQPMGCAQPNPDAIRVHHILPAEARVGAEPGTVLEEIERRLSGSVLIAHHARVELGFLKQAFAQLGKRWTRPPVVDTVRLIWKWASKKRFLGGIHGDPTVNLAEARAEFGLPPYPSHDALTDAVATAELFLALRARLAARTLSDLL